MRLFAFNLVLVGLLVLSGPALGACPMLSGACGDASAAERDETAHACCASEHDGDAAASTAPAEPLSDGADCCCDGHSDAPALTVPGTPPRPDVAPPPAPALAPAAASFGRGPSPRLQRDLTRCTPPRAPPLAPSRPRNLMLCVWRC